MKNKIRGGILSVLLASSVVTFAQTAQQPAVPPATMQVNSSTTSSNDILTKCDELASDTIIKTKLQTIYSLNPELERFNIRADVKNGAVRLSGAVQNTVQRDLAVTLAHDVAGVQDVTDSLVVDKNTQAGEVANAFFQNVTDATLTAMIKSRLVLNPKTSGFDIIVTTVNGIVTLTGEVGSLEEKKLAGNMAVKTTGVSAVKNNIKVVKGK